MRKTIPLLWVLIFASSLVFAQTGGPKFIRDAAVVNPDGTLSVIYTATGNYSAFGTITTDGEKATMQIPRNDRIQIVVKVKDNTQAPAEVIKAFKMKSKRGKRTASLGAYGIKSKDLVQFEYGKYGEDCFILTFVGLEPGEYGLWYAPEMQDFQLGGHQMTFFGVDMNQEQE